MKKAFAPNINLYSEILPFLQDFYSLNKTKNTKFSYRYLALKLNWSAPYLNDVIKGRKKLSLTKAIEFIQFLDLKGAKAERFLFLFLSDSNTEFSDSLLNKSALASRNTEKLHIRAMEFEEFEKLSTLLDYYILYFLELNKGVWNVDVFLSKLTLQAKPKPQTVENALNRLLKNNYIKFNPISSLYELQITDQLVFDQSPGDPSDLEKRRLDSLVKQEREYVTNYYNYLSVPISDRRTFCSGIINLDMELFAEAQDRIFALRNYLYELDVKGQARYSDAKGPDSRIWQFSINIFSLFESQEASLDNFSS